MKFCEQCGQQMEDAQKFCPACGTPSAVPADSATRQAGPQAGAQPGTSPGGPGGPGGHQYQQPMAGYPQQGAPYQQPGYMPYIDTRKTSGMGVAALVVSLVGLFLFGIPVVGIITEVLAIIFGGVCISQCNRQPMEYKGKGLGIAGLVIGIILLAILVIVLIVAGAAWSMLSRFW